MVLTEMVFSLSGAIKTKSSNWGEHSTHSILMLSCSVVEAFSLMSIITEKTDIALVSILKL